MFLDKWCTKTMRPKIELMKKEARMRGGIDPCCWTSTGPKRSFPAESWASLIPKKN